jgi:hypothetical protein
MEVSGSKLHAPAARERAVGQEVEWTSGGDEEKNF